MLPLSLCRSDYVPLSSRQKSLAQVEVSVDPGCIFPPPPPVSYVIIGRGRGWHANRQVCPVFSSSAGLISKCGFNQKLPSLPLSLSRALSNYIPPPLPLSSHPPFPYRPSPVSYITPASVQSREPGQPN